ncbi:MAG: pseudouridine synthase [Bacteroidales bacterium]|nr:pseudouridine synthase [Bacteroidales bacterium]
MARQFNKDNSEEDFSPRRTPRRPSENNKKRSFSSDNRRKGRFNEEDSDNSDRKFSRKRYSKEDKGNRKFDRSSGDGDRGFKRDRKYDGADDRGKGRDRSFKRGFRKDDDKPRKRNVVAESEILTEIIDRRRREGRTLPRKQRVLSLEYEELHGPIRLNKYIANAGICSRREADVLIATGAITVNGEVVTEMGHKVMPTDEVRYGDKILQREKPVYVLLNKPKDYITTTDDERGRANVMELVRDACEERIYPVGRLDRDTTGLLLFTNDGDLTKKLTHPSSEIEKTYDVELDKPFASVDMDLLRDNGVELHDGKIKPDEVEYVGEGKKEVGITIHSGKNRIVRRIFESLGYEVVKLDRVVFAGLTKKDLPRGRWRFLTKNEISFLKMLAKPKE